MLTPTLGALSCVCCSTPRVCLTRHTLLPLKYPYIYILYLGFSTSNKLPKSSLLNLAEKPNKRSFSTGKSV